jgi:hypothetical protein
MNRPNPRAIAAFALVVASTGAFAAPISVNVTGSLQNEAGCGGDFQPDCTLTNLVYDATDDVWQRALALPAASYQYIATLNGTFDTQYGSGGIAGGTAVVLNLLSSTTVKFYYDDKTHWVTDNVSSVIAVLAGSFQSEVGCGGDFDPECLRSWLQDVDGDGIYTYSTAALPVGSYSTIVAINESFSESYGKGGVTGGGNIDFDVASSGETITFSYDSHSHLLRVLPDGAVAAVPEPSTYAMTLAGLGALALIARRRRRQSLR